MIEGVADALTRRLQHIDADDSAGSASPIKSRHREYANVGSKAWRADLKYTLNDDGFQEIYIGVRLADRHATSAGTDLAQWNDMREKSKAVYTQLVFGFYDYQYAFDGNVGIRYVKTDSHSAYDPALQVQRTVGNSYSNILPSLNLSARGKDLVFRLGLSKAMARPDLLHSQIKLRPTTANQLDLSAEWYFAKPGSLTFAIFNKQLKDIAISQMMSHAHADGTGVSGSTRGAEISYQQHFTSLQGWASGLGAQANFTFTDGRVAGGQPIPGTSRQTANLSLMYDYKALSAHLGYNWRSRYLAPQLNRVTSLPFVPSPWVGAYGQIDASVFYKIGKQLSFGLEAHNLNNATFRQSIAKFSDTEVPMRFVQGRRYSAHMRYTF